MYTSKNKQDVISIRKEKKKEQWEFYSKSYKDWTNRQPSTKKKSKKKKKLTSTERIGRLYRQDESISMVDKLFSEAQYFFCFFTIRADRKMIQGRVDNPKKNSFLKYSAKREI